MAHDKQAVVEAALQLLDEVGSEGLTMRALAKTLGVQAPTLYWHFPSKQDLLDQMADRLIAPVISNVDVDAAPEDVLRSLADGLRTALLSRRDGARVYAGSYVMGENVLALADTALTAFLRKGLNESVATDAMFNLVYFVLGSVMEEQGFAGRWSDEAAVRQQFAETVKGRYPGITQCLDSVMSGSFERRFTRGVATFLARLPE